MLEGPPKMETEPMDQKITRDLVEKIRDRSNLLEIVRENHQTLQRGRIWFASVRPEKTPSFVIYPDGKWHDFGTSESGDVFRYVMMRDNVDFFEAVKNTCEPSWSRVRAAAGATLTRR